MPCPNGGGLLLSLSYDTLWHLVPGTIFPIIVTLGRCFCSASEIQCSSNSSLINIRVAVLNTL